LRPKFAFASQIIKGVDEMKVRDLLPLLPRYSDDSGYDVTVRYKQGVVGFYTMSFVSIHPDFSHRPFNSLDEILDEEVESIGAGYMTDNSLQIYLAT
jgi:hypothetical protein